MRAMEAAHIKRRKFAEEMLNQETERSQIVKREMASVVYEAIKAGNTP